MKKLNFLVALMIGAGSLLLLQSTSSGRAAVGSQDRTGSPIANGTCSFCHAGGKSTSTATIKDASGTTVTSYIPNQTYTVEYRIAAAGANGYGMQASILDASFNNAGDFLTTTSANTQLYTIASNGVEYMEHQGVQTAGIFVATWQAPTAGTGTVTLYGVGVAVDRNGGTANDETSPAIQVVLTEDNNTHVSHLQNDLSTVLEVYPMPNQGNFTITNNNKVTATMVQVVNMTGQVVASKQLNLGQYASEIIDFPHLVSGMYTLILEGENLRQTKLMSIVK